MIITGTIISTVIASFVGVSLYYTVEKLIKFYKRDNMDEEIEEKWDELMEECRCMREKLRKRKTKK